MGIEFGPGSLAAALGLAGTGLAIMLPNSRWVGALLIIMAIAVLFFDVRISGGHLEGHMPGVTNWRQPAAIGMAVFGLSFIVCLVLFWWPTTGDLASQADPQTGAIPLPPEILAQANRAVENLSHAPNDELRSRTAKLVIRLRDFAAKASVGFQAIMDKYPTARDKAANPASRNDSDVRALNEEFMKYSNEQMAILNQSIRPEAIALRDIMLQRSPAPPETKDRIAAITFFQYSNANATIAYMAADYLEALARSLP